MLEAEAHQTICHKTIQSKGDHHGLVPITGGLCVASQCSAWLKSYLEGDDGFCGLVAGNQYGHPPGTVDPGQTSQTPAPPGGAVDPQTPSP